MSRTIMLGCVALALCVSACGTSRTEGKARESAMSPSGTTSSRGPITRDAATASGARPAGTTPSATRIGEASGTAYFAPDAQSFWVQDNSGDALVRFGVDGARLGVVKLAGPLGEAALWIRTQRAVRPISPDGKRIVETRTEPRGDKTAFVVDVDARTEEPLPVDLHARVDWLADGRMLVVDLGSEGEARPVALLDLATQQRTPICAGVKGIDGVFPTSDGRALVVETNAGSFLADLTCKKTRALSSEAGATPLGSPHQKAWLVTTPAHEVKVLEPTARLVGTFDAVGGVAWLDDETFVFVDEGQARFAAASTSAPSQPITPIAPGCRDKFVTGAPEGGSVVFSRSCEGAPAAVYVVR